MVETSSPVYLIYLITPYIIVSYFLLYSIIHSRISGLIYIVGLIVCILFTSFVGNGIENIVTSGITKPSNYICNSFSINGLFSGSQIPVSIAIYVFTLMYLLYTVIITSYILPNILPLFITAAIMGYCGINLKPSTILVFSIANTQNCDF